MKIKKLLGLPFKHKNLDTNIMANKGENNYMKLFPIEGVLFGMVMNMVMFNNNLFATRLGATDFQLSLVSSLPQVISMLVLIPGAIFTDRMVNKRRMVIIMLSCLASAYMLLGFVPMMGTFRLTAFLILLALSTGPMTLYNTSWQAYFSDVVTIDTRNKTYTMRTRGLFLVSILVPLATGALLSSVPSNAEKLVYHQSFLWLGCVLLVVQMFVLSKINGGNVKSQPARFHISDLKTTIIDLAHNKKFLGFVGVALFFYLTWQIDWTIMFISQIKYLQLNESWLSYVNVGAAVMQFLTVGFWGRMNEKLGIRFTIIIGSLGLAFYPINMIISTSLPIGTGAIVFLILNSINNITFGAVILNLLQCLLQVVPEKNKTLCIALYTVLTSLSNAVMPVVGVQIYTALGSSLQALQTTYFLVFTLRLMAAGLWTLRWWMLRKEPK